MVFQLMMSFFLVNIQAIGAENGILVSQPAVSRLQMYRNQLAHTFQGFSVDRLRNELRKPRTWGMLGCGVVIVGAGCYAFRPRAQKKQPEVVKKPSATSPENSTLLKNDPHNKENKALDAEEQERKSAFDIAFAAFEDIKLKGLEKICENFLHEKLDENNDDYKIIEALSAYDATLVLEERKLMFWVSSALEIFSKPFELGYFSDGRECQAKKDFPKILGDVLYGLTRQNKSVELICEAIIADRARIYGDESAGSKTDDSVGPWVVQLKKNLEAAKQYATKPDEPRLLLGREACNRIQRSSQVNPTRQTDDESSDTGQPPAEDVPS